MSPRARASHRAIDTSWQQHCGPPNTYCLGERGGHSETHMDSTGVIPGCPDLTGMPSHPSSEVETLRLWQVFPGQPWAPAHRWGDAGWGCGVWLLGCLSMWPVSSLPLWSRAQTRGPGCPRSTAEKPQHLRQGTDDPCLSFTTVERGT